MFHRSSYGARSPSFIVKLEVRFMVVTLYFDGIPELIATGVVDTERLIEDVQVGPADADAPDPGIPYS